MTGNGDGRPGNGRVDDGRVGDGPTPAEAAFLPAWLAERLAAGPARFGVLMITGHVLVVDRSGRVRQSPAGQVWLDVEVLVPFKKDGFPWGHFPLVKRTADDRAAAAINAAHVVALVEVDTWEVPPLQPSAE